MFLFHIGFSLELIALIFGTALYVWGLRNTGSGVLLAKIIGFLTLLFSAIAVICSLYFNMKFWQDYREKGPMGMRGMQMQNEKPVPAKQVTVEKVKAKKS